MKSVSISLGKKLALSFGVIVALMLFLAAFSLYKMHEVETVVSEQNQIRTEKLERLYTIREALAQTGLAARNAYIFSDSADAARELDILDREKTLYLETLQAVTPLFRGNPQFEKVRAGLLNMAEELKRPRQFRNSGEMQAYGEFLVKECSPLRRQIVADLDLLVSALQQLSNEGTQAVDQTIVQSGVVISILAGLILLSSTLIGVAVTRGLLRQLGGDPAYASGIANRIAQGDLTVDIATRPNDRVSLLFAMKTMRDGLVNIVSQVRTSTDTIATGSREIASGNQDLSSRTEEQASSLEQTASSMEELTSTVRQNADNARQANQLAVVASEVAVKGGSVVSEVVHTMDDINESSKKIVDIISVIDGIAFQTNILALNAAVEAARAGEQGRGFAVVASEVRSLAQRSASAAREVKELIDNSVQKVETGSALVGEAGNTMSQVVESVKRVTDIMTEITTASQAQASGIEQVNQAVAHMDQGTQQNAALVEEAAAASQSMQQEAANLARIVSVFRLSGGQPGAAS